MGTEAVYKKTRQAGWRLNVWLGYALFRVLQLMRMLGFRAGESGWRRTASIFLRSEPAKFTLTAFGLDYASNAARDDLNGRERREAEQHVARRLAVWLRTEQAAPWQIEWTRFAARRRPKTLVDVTIARFDGEGRLESIDPALEAESQATDELGDEAKKRLRQLLVSIYNDTRDLDDRRRARVLKKLLVRSIDTVLIHAGNWGSTLAREEAQEYVGRIMSSSFVSFETLSAEEAAGAVGRFQVPDFRRRKHPGFGVLNFHVRFAPELLWADLWMQIDHVAVDGVPMQEALDALKEEWGVCAAPTFPTPQVEALPAVRCSTPETAEGVYAQVALCDFQNLLKVRAELNEKYRDRLHGGVTVSSLLVWALAHHPTFRGKTFAVTVDVAKRGDQERVVGLVPMRPETFFGSNEGEGFVRYIEEFNRRIEAARGRTGTIHRLFDATAPLPPAVHRLAAGMVPGFIAEVVGTVGVSVIKEAEVFVAPYNGLFTDGFLAFGNLSIPTDTGGTAGAVSIKGTEEDVRASHQAVREVLEGGGELRMPNDE